MSSSLTVHTVSKVCPCDSLVDPGAIHRRYHARIRFPSTTSCANRRWRWVARDDAQGEVRPCQLAGPPGRTGPAPAWRNRETPLDPARLVFIDGTWAKTNMGQAYGRTANACAWAGPYGHSKTSIFVTGLTLSGMIAPFVLHRPINRSVLETDVEKVLVPELRPRGTVLMENLSSHRRKGVGQSIDAAGAKIPLLPPYSPNLDPIDMAFAKLHTLLRNAAERTVDGPWIAIARIFHPRGMQKLLRRCRILSNLIGYCSDDTRLFGKSNTHSALLCHSTTSFNCVQLMFNSIKVGHQ